MLHHHTGSEALNPGDYVILRCVEEPCQGLCSEGTCSSSGVGPSTTTEAAMRRDFPLAGSPGARDDLKADYEAAVN